MSTTAEKTTETNANSLLNQLITKQDGVYIIKYDENVKNPNERYRTPSELRAYLKKNRLIYSNFTYQNGSLFAVFTKDKQPGQLLSINNSNYLRISAYERHFKHMLVTSNELTFNTAEEGDGFLILKLTTRGLSTMTDTVKKRGRKRRNFSEATIENIRRRYHKDGEKATTIAKELDVSVSMIYKLAGSNY